MSPMMTSYKLTTTGAVIALLIFIITAVFDIELFEMFIAALHSLEHLEVDELIIPSLIFFIFGFIDLRKKRKNHELEVEKIKIYKAMLSSTHHVLNNFLNQMQIFRLDAEHTPGFDPDVLEMYKEIVNDAQTQIDALGSITQIDEETIQNSVLPK